MPILGGEAAVAFFFGGAVVEVEYAAGLPAAVGQQAVEQAAAVAVAAEQQFGLFGIVGGNFGIQQALTVAAGGMGGGACFQYADPHAAFRQCAGGGRPGNARTDDGDVFGRCAVSVFRRPEPRFLFGGRALRAGFRLPFEAV